MHSLLKENCLAKLLRYVDLQNFNEWLVSLLETKKRRGIPLTKDDVC